MLAFLIGSVLFAACILADVATSERLDDRPGASEANPAFRDADGKHSTTKRLLWAGLFAGLACIGAYAQSAGYWPGALLWVGCYAYAGFRGARGALGNWRRLRHGAPAATLTETPAAPKLSPRAEARKTSQGRPGDTDG